MTISIQMLSNNEYEVTVQSNTITTHIVSLSDEVHKNLTNNKVTKDIYINAKEILIPRLWFSTV